MLAKLFWFGHHGTKHPTNSRAFRQQGHLFFLGEIAASCGCAQPMLCFSLFSVGICQFANEVSDIAAFLPCFGKVGPD